jgi:hypothetical protein
LITSDGETVSSHDGKASLLLESYKDSLGRSESTDNSFNMSSLLATSSDISFLEEPFSAKEIDDIINDFPNNKSPGPDGFNAEFLRKCWPIIKNDFYELCNQLHQGSLCLDSMNGCFITLVPKMDGANSTNDFRLISLLNCTLKLITKLLANRLQKVIMQLIHENQYGFIESRTIQDCLSWAYEYLHMCHNSKRATVILKLDFEKAFDKVEHEFILQVLQPKGFGPKWCHWIQQILASATSSVLLNGVPGDPLSPLLFVLAADFLQTIVNDAMSQGHLTRPLPLNSTPNFPIIQYVDDTLVILPAEVNQLLHLKSLLLSFGDATGLKVNYGKSNLIPINVDEDLLHMLVAALNCQQGSLPFTYLGLPLSTTKPRKESFMPLLLTA